MSLTLTPRFLSSPPSRPGQYARAGLVHAFNDVPSYIFGQGLTKAQPGETQSYTGEARVNYFLMFMTENMGFNRTWSMDSPLGQIEQYYDGDFFIRPRTNQTAVPYWGEELHWASGLSGRIQIMMISTQVNDGSSTSSDSVAPSNDLLIVEPIPYETPIDGHYAVEYVISAGHTYNVYIWFDGVEIPGSPYLLSMETGEVSPTLTHPADLSRPVPRIDYGPDGHTPIQQHYGDFADLAEPLGSPGYGLVRGVKKGAASFLLQIVDIYANNWIDNSNALVYLNSSIYSGVPYDAINLTMTLHTKDGAFIRDLSLQDDYHYINNEDGPCARACWLSFCY